MAEVRVTVEDQDTTTWAIFGEDESGEALLGAVTLQELLLGIDTYHERLVPIQGLLKWRGRGLSLEYPRARRRI